MARFPAGGDRSSAGRFRCLGARFRSVFGHAAAALVLVGFVGTPKAFAAIEDHQWCRTKTEHFDLVTDLDLRRTAELFLSLDRFRVAASALLPGLPPEHPVPLKILVFKNTRDFALVFQAPYIAGFMRPTLNQSLLAFGPDRSGQHLHAIAYHEYTHYLLRSRAMLNLPVWYEEGLASYLSTLDMDPQGVVTVGRGPAALLRFVVKRPELDLEDVIAERFRLDWQRHDLSSVYTLAWGIVRFIHHGRRPDGTRYAEQLGAMLDAIDRGASSSDAMREHLGIEPSELQDLMRAYYAGSPENTLSVYKFPVGDYDMPAFDRTCLDGLEARRVLADAVGFQRADMAARLYRDILAEKPRHVGGLVGLSRVDPDPENRDRLARQAYAEAPDDPDVNLRMAQLIVAPCPEADCARDWDAAKAFYRTALGPERDRADAAFGLGMLHLRDGRPETAMEYLALAYARAPWSPRVNYYLGEAFGMLGDADRARRHLRKTQYWDPDDDWRQRAARALARVGGVELRPGPEAESNGATSLPEARE